MMNLSETTSESSCKRQEDGDDVSTVAERPLKKARFAWQVKGKYHLKNEFSDNEKCGSTSTNNINTAGSSCTQANNCKGLVGNTEQNLEILGDYLLKQDFNTLDSVIADTDSSLPQPNTNLPTETLLYPKYVSSCDNNNYSNECSTSANNMIEYVPMSLVTSASYNEDQCIARWQARQMAKGFVDNTINRVLDSWMVTPLQAEMDNNRSLALGVADFINNLPGDNSIENEGILMAISAHGLQNTSNTTSNDNFNSEQISNSFYNKDDVFLSPPTSPTLSDSEIINSMRIKKDKDTEGSSIEHSPSSNVQKKICEYVTPLTLSPEPSSPTLQYFSEDEYIETLNNDYSRNDGISECDFTNHYDFLDTAVSFAIQNKGLTSFGTDYG